MEQYRHKKTKELVSRDSVFQHFTLKSNKFVSGYTHIPEIFILHSSDWEKVEELPILVTDETGQTVKDPKQNVFALFADSKKINIYTAEFYARTAKIIKPHKVYANRNTAEYALFFDTPILSLNELQKRCNFSDSNKEKMLQMAKEKAQIFAIKETTIA